MLKRFEAAILSLLAGALIYGVTMQTTSDAAMSMQKNGMRKLKSLVSTNRMSIFTSYIFCPR